MQGEGGGKFDGKWSVITNHETLTAEGFALARKGGATIEKPEGVRGEPMWAKEAAGWARKLRGMGAPSRRRADQCCP